LILLSLALIALSLPAFAQDTDLPEIQTYDPTFSGRVNQTANQIRNMKAQSLSDKGFIKPSTVQVSIVHPDYMDDDQFGLQMAVPDVVSGCYELTPLEYEANFVDPYFLDIKVKKYRRIAPEGANAGNCGTENKQSTGLMVLSRKDLEKRGTKEIRFSTETVTDTYQIFWSASGIELKPESMVVFKAQNMGGSLKDRITYEFKNQTMVVLQVPMAEPSDDVERQIAEFAMVRALSPAGESEASPNGKRVYYFYDNGGHIAGEIGPEGYGELGRITVGRPMDGPGGRRVVAKELSVFVTRPGTEL